MKKIFLLLILTISAVAVGAPKKKLTQTTTEKKAEHTVLKLTTGEDKILDFDFEISGNNDGVVVGNPKTLVTQKVKIGESRKQLVLKPLSEGTSTVHIRDEDGSVRVILAVQVTGSNLLRIAGEIRSLTRDMEGLNVKVVGGKVVLDGELIVPEDYGRLIAITTGKASPYSDVVLNLTKLSALALDLLSRKIQAEIRGTSGAENVRTRVVNGVIWLEGNVPNAAVAKRAEKIASLYLPPIKPGEQIARDQTAQAKTGPQTAIMNFLVIDPPPPKKTEKLVRVTVHFVELSKDYNKLFGFKWQPGVTTDSDQMTVGATQAGTAGASSGASFTATISNLLPKLQSAQNAGFARILKTGTVIVRSGQKANLQDRVLIPYPVQGPNGQVTTQVQGVGLLVNVVPSVLGTSEDIQMNLQMTQQNLVGKTDTGVPIVSDHTVNTLIYVKSRESAAVAGVESADVQTSFNKDDPNAGSFSGNTSPLFTLVRSKSYAKKRGQFAIFVTPEIVNSASEGTEDLRRNFRVKVN